MVILIITTFAEGYSTPSYRELGISLVTKVSQVKIHKRDLT